MTGKASLKISELCVMFLESNAQKFNRLVHQRKVYSYQRFCILIYHGEGH